MNTFKVKITKAMRFFNFKSKQNPSGQPSIWDTKYYDLVSYLMRGHPENRIFKKAYKSIRLGVDNYAGKTIFEMEERNSDLIIEMKIDMAIVGKKRLKWNFSQEMNQEDMLQKIHQDIQRLRQ